MFFYRKRQENALYIQPGKSSELLRQLHFAPLIIDELQFSQPLLLPHQSSVIGTLIKNSTLTFNHTPKHKIKPVPADLLYECLSPKLVVYPDTPRPFAKNLRHPDLRHTWQLHTIILRAKELRLHFTYIPSIDDAEPLLATLSFTNSAGFESLSCHAFASSVNELYHCSTKVLDTSANTALRHIISVEYTYIHYTTKKPAATSIILDTSRLNAHQSIDTQYTTTLEYSHG